MSENTEKKETKKPDDGKESLVKRGKDWFSAFVNKNYTPFGGDYLDENKRLVFNNRILMYIIPFLTLINITLVFAVIRMFLNNNTSIMLPPYDTFNISKANADRTYFQIWGEWLTLQAGTINENDVGDKLNYVIRYFDRNSLTKNKARLEQYQNAIKTNKISMNFSFNSNNTVVNMDETGSRARVTVAGVSEQVIDNRIKIEKKCGYQMTFLYSKRSIFVTGFATDCFANKSQTDDSKPKTQEELNKEIFKQGKDGDASKVFEENVIRRESVSKIKKSDGEESKKEDSFDKLKGLDSKDLSVDTKKMEEKDPNEEDPSKKSNIMPYVEPGQENSAGQGNISTGTQSNSQILNQMGNPIEAINGKPVEKDPNLEIQEGNLTGTQSDETIKQEQFVTE